MRILLVESATVAAAMVKALETECYSVDLAADGESADELYFVNDYDLAVLAWQIPAPTGIELLHAWREAGGSTPVLMLTDNRDDLVSALDAGADDCMLKPVSRREFLARVRSLLRRKDRPLPELNVANICMDRAKRRVTVGGDAVELSPKEFSILEYFLARPGEVITRTELIEHMWDDEFDSMSNVVDVTIHRLRAKIDAADEEPLLRTIKGVGYVLDES